MKINFNHPKYKYPLFALLPIFFIFYAYKDYEGTKKDDVTIVEGNEGLQPNISSASKQVQTKSISEKLEAVNNQFDTDKTGSSAMVSLGEDSKEKEKFEDLYSDHEKQSLDSAEKALKRQLATSQKASQGYVNRASHPNDTDKALLQYLNNSNEAMDRPQTELHDQNYDKDDPNSPSNLMKTQFSILDSMQKANDPEYKMKIAKARQDSILAQKKRESQEKQFQVSPARQETPHFNTLKPQQETAFIKAIIDQDIKAYAGSRIRIRLLEDILVGKILIKRGSYLFAQVNGFSAQRITLSISSVLKDNDILPIDLSIYDLDGMEGLYIPESAFREFSQQLGSTTIQGMNLNSTSSGEQQQFLQNAIQGAIQSTSTAISKAIRKNKAKLKYSTYVYLIDSKQQRNR